VNSQLLIEINFEILFCNLEHVLFCKILLKKFHLWSTVIGQSASVLQISNEASMIWLSKVYFQRESAYFQKKQFKNFYLEIEFRNKFPMWKGPYDRYSSFDMNVSIFDASGWKLPTHAPKIGVWGQFDHINGLQYQPKPKKTHSCMSPCHLSHQVWKSCKQSDL